MPDEAKADDTDGLDVTIDFEALFQPDRERFYEVDYRAHLRKMIEQLVETEGPIYFDVLVERVARAHGFQRSGETVQKVIDAALGRRGYPCSKDVDRDVIWPTDAIIEKIAYRGTMGREHADIPLLELAGLADLLRARGLEEEEDIVRAMKDHFGLAGLQCLSFTIDAAQTEPRTPLRSENQRSIGGRREPHSAAVGNRLRACLGSAQLLPEENH